jgi:ATP-dependent helicase/nuclease subunit B
MDVVFGIWADGGASPDHGCGEHGGLGQPVIGPLGLVELLETRLGLGGPVKPQVVRVAAFQAALEGLHGSYFWSRSLVTDPWSTAQTLLGWRDALVGLGWRPDRAWVAPRLKDLAEAARATEHLPAGLSDRVQAVLAALQVIDQAPLARIRMMDPPAVLSSPLRRLVERLGVLGCTIEVMVASPAAPSDTALGKLQRWMLGEYTITDADLADGTVTLASAASEPLAAEIVGQWFAQQGDGATTLIAQEADTDLLDHGLAAAGQPRAGRSRRSVHRGSLQLLLLAFKGAWAPFDPHALMELLVFPDSPIAPRAAGRLAAALMEAPGRGGPEWAAAWTAIEDQERERAQGQADEVAAIEARLARWRAWTEPQAADPVAGMALAQSLALCDRVTSWAARRHGATGELLHAATASLAGEVRSALAALGRDRLPRLLMERVIGQAMADGLVNPEAAPEAAAWRSVAHAGAIWAPRSTVAWWNFVATQEGAGRAPWTQVERDELLAAGCPADETTLAAAAASAGWERAVLNARDRLVLFTGGLDCSSDERLHPLAHRLKPALDALAEPVTLEAALRGPTLALAGAVLERAPIAARPLPTARFEWAAPAGFATRVDEATQSATSLERLLSCQLLWALRHVARLQPGRVRSIPDANRLLGNLAHAIAREVFAPGAPPDPQAAFEQATGLLDGLIDRLAAPLRHPEAAVDLNIARQRLPAAMAALARSLAENNLVVEAAELQVSGSFEALLALRGAIDLVARDPAGRAVIVDLKWTRSEGHRIEELKSGLAVQLATYGALLSPDAPYRAGYYLLNQRQFATLRGSGLVGRSVEGARSFAETWDGIRSDWAIWRQSAATGRLLATGVEGVEALLPGQLTLRREVRCDRCDYSTLCRVRGLA